VEGRVVMCLNSGNGEGMDTMFGHDGKGTVLKEGEEEHRRGFTDVSVNWSLGGLDDPRILLPLADELSWNAYKKGLLNFNRLHHITPH